MGGQRKAAVWTAGILALGLTLYSAWKLIATGVLSWHVSQREYHFMMAEMVFLWLILSVLFKRGKNVSVVRGGVAVIAAVFSWLHMIFLPIVFTACYVTYLIWLGKWLGRRLSQRMGICWEFFAGAAVTVLVFCLFSLAGLGCIRNLRIWVLASGFLLLLREMRLEWEKFQKAGEIPSEPCGNRKAVMVAAIAALVLLQAGRLNLAVDFDSLWYGVRSHVMLDSGNGIYENLGTLGVVYTYPKGWEVLTLPLAGLPSYSFSTAMNLWVAVLALLALYETASLCMERERALWVPFLAASVPGIMNMSVTAKADMMTLFCQILMIQAVLRYEKEQKSSSLILGLSAGAFSLGMKPTAVVFSTAVAGMSVLWLLWRIGSDGRRRIGDGREGRENRYSGIMLVIASGALAGIWGRTIHLVGVPVTSVFYQIFQKLGFRVKYPFYAAGFPSAGRNLEIGQQIRFLCGRLYGLFLNPQGEDMAHVIIAWGGILPLIFFIFFLCMSISGKRHKKARETRRTGIFLAMLLAALLFIDLVSLYSLSQIDGNYYMLTYAVMLLAGGVWLEQEKISPGKTGKAALISAWCYGVLMCGLTNWAWALGNGGIHLTGRGYYPHLQEEREKRAAQGSSAIWDILSSDPRTRVIALGEHPGVLAFPCCVQSYVDVSGYWGNPEVVANAPNFLEYLQYAGIDYLYMEKEYVDSSVRIYQIIRTLIQEGWLGDVRDENGNLILSVCREEGRFQEEAEKNLTVFDRNYVQHP